MIVDIASSSASVTAAPLYTGSNSRIVVPTLVNGMSRASTVNVPLVYPLPVAAGVTLTIEPPSTVYCIDALPAGLPPPAVFDRLNVAPITSV